MCVCGQSSDILWVKKESYTELKKKEKKNEYKNIERKKKQSNVHDNIFAQSIESSKSLWERKIKSARYFYNSMLSKPYLAEFSGSFEGPEAK